MKVLWKSEESAKMDKTNSSDLFSAQFQEDMKSYFPSILSHFQFQLLDGKKLEMDTLQLI